MRYTGDKKPYDEWQELLCDYNGVDEITVFNASGKTVSSVCQSAKRYLLSRFDNARVVSQGGVIIINPKLKKVTRVPGCLYYEGRWDDVVRDLEYRKSAQVINLTYSLKKCCDFTKQLNRYLTLHGLDLEARSVKGVCVLGTKEYWRLRKHV